MPTLPQAQESIPPGEARTIANLIESLKEKLLQEHTSGAMPRDVHIKMHALVKAEFSVLPNLPPELRVGVFKESRTYQAWIRFSNSEGVIKPDAARDARGMAIKLMGVPGAKLLPLEKDAQTQDFILVSTPVFPTRDVEEFAVLASAMAGSLLAKLRYFLTHWRALWILLRALRKFANPLQIAYYSTTPYLFGSSAVKYSAIPRVSVPDPMPDAPADDYLRLAIIRQLREGEALFDFCVQLQTDPARMPIEDPRYAWPVALSPPRKAASIRIMRQDLELENLQAFGENMSFSPWHALPEHRPLGGINRARKVVYEAISTFRHRSNQTPRKEPETWET